MAALALNGVIPQSLSGIPNSIIHCLPGELYAMHELAPRPMVSNIRDEPQLEKYPSWFKLKANGL